MNRNNGQKFTHDEMQAALALSVWKDDSLRNRIMKDPKAVIEKELGVKFDNHIKVGVVNCTDPNEVIFILPYDINKATDQELSDDQLEVVAGGFSVKNIAKDIPWEQVGGEVGNLAGDEIIKAAKSHGVNLPSTGLGRVIGSAIGSEVDRGLHK